jgi:hypothetical protein
LPTWINSLDGEFYGLMLCAVTQEEIMGFPTTQIHYVLSEMGQSSLICNLHGFSLKGLVD